MQFKELEELTNTKTLYKNKKQNNDINLSSIIGKEIPHQDSIRLGNIIENYLNLILEQLNIKVNIKAITTENDKLKQIDICFKINNIYYYELKSNINLDSEKSKKTIRKIDDITKSLEIKYKEKVISGCLSIFYKDTFKGISVNKHSVLKNVCYMKDFFNIINIDISEEQWYSLIKKLHNNMEKNDIETNNKMDWGKEKRNKKIPVLYS